MEGKRSPKKPKAEVAEVEAGLAGEADAPAQVPRVVRLDADLWDRIDEYWHRERLASRTAAVRELLELGLKGGG